MNRTRGNWVGLAATCAGILTTVLALPGAAAGESHERSAVPNITVFVNSGLNNPRGLRFGPDGYLYVAEGGTGGSQPACSVVPAVGPYTGSETGGRISRIDRHGHRTTVTDTLPSSQTSMQSGGFISGVADIAFVDGTMYALLAGAGCSHGVNNTSNGIARVHRNGTWELIADLSAFQKAHPVKNPNPGDFEPDGTWWSMVAVRGDLYAVEPNHGELDKITTRGKVTRVIDISASQGHVVPTSVAYRGNFFVSNLGTFDPDQLNTQSIFEITEAGHLRVVATGLSKVLGLAFDEHGRLFVLETSYSATDPGPVPGTGRLIRIRRDGRQEVIIDSTSGLLTFPTGMAFGPDDALYIANVGFGLPPGLGQILRVQFRDDD